MQISKLTLQTTDTEIDKGEIIYQEEVKAKKTDTGKTLYEKLEDGSMDVLRKELVGYYHKEMIPFIPKEKGSYYSYQDFVDLFEIDFKEMIKAIDLIKNIHLNLIKKQVPNGTIKQCVCDL